MEEEKKFIEKYIIGDTPCVLALSGGPDSMCLLNLLYSLHKNVICVHINHKTRKECEEEYAFVKNYLQKLLFIKSISSLDNVLSNIFIFLLAVMCATTL